jgi:hypothetical protein
MARLLLVFFIGLLLAGCTSSFPKSPINLVSDTAYLANCEALGFVTLPLVSAFKSKPSSEELKFTVAEEFPSADHAIWSEVTLVGTYPLSKWKATGTALRCYQ